MSVGVVFYKSLVLLIVWTKVEVFVAKTGNYRKTVSSFEWVLQCLPMETAVKL